MEQSSILSADADGVDVLLLNVGQHHASAVTDDLRRGIDVKGVGCIPESLLHVRSERLLAFIRKGDIALSDGDGVHGTAISNTSHLRDFLFLLICLFCVEKWLACLVNFDKKFKMRKKILDIFF